MKFHLLAATTTAVLALAPLSAAEAAKTRHTGPAEGCPPAGGWFSVRAGTVVENIVLRDSVFADHDRNGDGTLCTKVVPSPKQDLPNRAAGGGSLYFIDNTVGATS